MDYNEVRYPEIVASAQAKGMVINTIQSGDMPVTIEPWTQIANLGQGSFFHVEQSGSAVAYSTPFDEEIATLSAKIDNTRLYYGNDDDKAKMALKVAATDKLHADASLASRARRAVFNSAAGGRANLLGEKELVDAVASGEIELDEIDANALPEAMKPMAPESRSDYLAKKVEEAGGLRDSLDQKLYDAVREQAGKAGLEYEDGPAY